MKLVRFGDPGQERPGVVDTSGTLRDLSSLVADWAGDALGDAFLARLRSIDPTTLPAVPAETRLGPPVGLVRNIIAVGLNYSDHAAETGATVPPEPILFSKATASIIGPNDDVVIPKASEHTDWEVELGVVIGSRASHVSEADALAHVAGYCVVNDISERAWQLHRHGQWLKGKSADTFCPFGPWLVTRDEVANPQALPMWLEVNGHRYQNGSTATMVYGVAFLIHYISQLFTLLPGDLITTGTPPGVGMGQTPPIYLKPGDVMSLGIDGLGIQRQDVRAFDG